MAPPESDTRTNYRRLRAAVPAQNPRSRGALTGPDGRRWFVARTIMAAPAPRRRRRKDRAPNACAANSPDSTNQGWPSAATGPLSDSADPPTRPTERDIAAFPQCPQIHTSCGPPPRPPRSHRSGQTTGKMRRDSATSQIAMRPERTRPEVRRSAHSWASQAHASHRCGAAQLFRQRWDLLSGRSTVRLPMCPPPRMSGSGFLVAGPRKLTGKGLAPCRHHPAPPVLSWRAGARPPACRSWASPKVSKLSIANGP